MTTKASQKKEILKKNIKDVHWINFELGKKREVFLIRGNKRGRERERESGKSGSWKEKKKDEKENQQIFFKGIIY